MSKPTKRIKQNILIEFQMTEAKASFVNNTIHNVVKALELQPYPNEVVNPTKGDFIRVSYSEPKPAKAK